MNNNGIRRGWREAEIEAAVRHLEGEKFTGELEYQIEPKGLRGVLGCQARRSGVAPQGMEWLAAVRQWTSDPEGSLRIQFIQGVVTRVEH